MTEISVPNMGIKSLKGIAIFPNLQSLNCEGNDLTVIDVSNNTKLTELKCNKNKIIKLIAPTCQYLNCSDNKLEELNLSENVGLRYIDCSGNKLTDLDITNNPKVLTGDSGTPSIFGPQQNNGEIAVFMKMAQYEDYENKNLSEEFEKARAKAIFYPFIEDKAFRKYILKNFDANGDGDLSDEEIEQVERIEVGGMSIKSLAGIEVFSNLKRLDCKNNSITELDLSKNTLLEVLDCSNNELKGLDLSNNTKLGFLSCIDNEINYLDLCNSPNLNMTLISIRQKGIWITVRMTESQYEIFEKWQYSLGDQNVTVEVSSDYQVSGPFADVDRDSYCYAPVLWAVEQGITEGTSATTFDPNSTCTRGQVVTFLWRAAGCPEPESTTNPFTDVKSDAYYEKAVLWAVEKGITEGTSAATFNPKAACTRGQIVTFLWRAAGCPEPETTANPFTDVKSGAYYEKAVLWAAENGITTGTSAATFDPKAACTRGQVVTFLWRAK